MMALNAELKTRWWLWTPKPKSDDDSERQTEDATLNVDLKTDDGSERRTKNTMMALNASWKCDDGFERRQMEKW